MNNKTLNKKNGSRRLNIMFGDLCYENRQTMYEQYVPLSIGMIAQYAIQEFGDDIKASLYKNIDDFLDNMVKDPPDVVGLSVYYWNLSLNQYLIKCIREKLGQNVVIVLGGPCIDSDKKEQHHFIANIFPQADAIVLNEGEISFNNIIREVIGNRENLFKNPIDGLSFLDGNQLISGKPVGLSMDLSTFGSPYLTGLMDKFMDSDFQPLVQTSRFCPYTCAFCVSGKNRGKLRGFPIEQVKEELIYISKKYADRPYLTMYLADENFGIMKRRDIEIAYALRKCKEDYKYPLSVSFYNDKRFTQTSRKILEILGDQTSSGVVLALQTDNPLALKAINRSNVTEAEIDDAIVWAKNLNLTVSTDLIFGLPHETRDSFVQTLDRATKRGFDNVAIKNLILMDGVEMNRKDYREKYYIKTRYRIVGTHYTKHNGNFIAEHEEVVVGSNSLTYEEFLEVRYMSFMFYTVLNFHFQKWFFQFARHLGIETTKFFSHFFKPDKNEDWPKEYIRFLADFRNAVEAEMFKTREEMVANAKKIYEENGNEVGESTRININFGARINYQESAWTKKVLLLHLDKIMNDKLSDEDRNLASLLIELSERERVDLKNISEKQPLKISFDVICWKNNKFKQPLSSLKIPEKTIKFSTNENQVSMIIGLQKRFADYNDLDYYHEALERIRPRKFLLHELSYQ